MRFRKLPVVIDAIQYNGANHEELGLFAGDAVWLERGILFVRTLENRRLEADCGDWIIKGIKGEFYPCKPDIFAATYEPIEDHDAPRLPLAPGLVAREIARMLEEQREAWRYPAPAGRQTKGLTMSDAPLMPLMPLSEIERLTKSTPQSWTWEESRRFLATARLAHALRNSLHNLLAVVHRDGGHHTAAHGTDESSKDAEALVTALREENARLRAHQPKNTDCISAECLEDRLHSIATEIGYMEQLHADNAALRAVVEAARQYRDDERRGLLDSGLSDPPLAEGTRNTGPRLDCALAVLAARKRNTTPIGDPAAPAKEKDNG